MNKEWVKFLLKNALRHFIDMASKRGESFNINLTADVVVSVILTFEVVDLLEAVKGGTSLLKKLLNITSFLETVVDDTRSKSDSKTE